MLHVPEPRGRSFTDNAKPCRRFVTEQLTFRGATLRAPKPIRESRQFSATLTPVGRLSDAGRVIASVFARQSLSELRLVFAPLNAFCERARMPNVTRLGSLDKAASRDESQIPDQLTELREFTRSKGYVHTARMIEEALSVYSLEQRHFGPAKKYFSKVQQLKGIELSGSAGETGRKRHPVPSFRSVRSKKPNGLPLGTAERAVGPVQKAGTRQRQMTFVLTARMRVDGRNVTALHNELLKGRSVPFDAEPEFQFR
ncbi:hypothetical protein RUA4292_02207 [Ruegeria atlantica]|uniref:Uncharacterized protein n=2 Tax=Ruegeria atlantica TaxID=81569 RepID=A0A0P1EEQ6_9RHOB|nr:hypothetical protein RUA4292_02207 [Ruegeria atlantica]